MTVPSLAWAMRPSACRMLVLVALLAVVADADARGGRRGGSSRSSASSRSESTGGTTINLRTSGFSSPSSGSSQEELYPGGRMAVKTPGGSSKSDAPMTPEEAARFATLRAQDEREDAQKAAEKAAARKAASEKAEAERLAAEQTAAAKKAAEEKAKTDQVTAAQRQKQREEAAVASDVDRVLQRARADYAMLNTREGQPVLARIMERQRELSAGGMYPSQAMVQAIADHEYLLRPVEAKALSAAALAAPVAEQAVTAPAQARGGCRWVTPIQWACDK